MLRTLLSQIGLTPEMVTEETDTISDMFLSTLNEIEAGDVVSAVRLASLQRNIIAILFVAETLRCEVPLCFTEGFYQELLYKVRECAVISLEESRPPVPSAIVPSELIDGGIETYEFPTKES